MPVMRRWFERLGEPEPIRLRERAPQQLHADGHPIMGKPDRDGDSRQPRGRLAAQLPPACGSPIFAAVRFSLGEIARYSSESFVAKIEADDRHAVGVGRDVARRDRDGSPAIRAGNLVW